MEGLHIGLPLGYEQYQQQPLQQLPFEQPSAEPYLFEQPTYEQMLLDPRIYEPVPSHLHTRQRRIIHQDNPQQLYEEPFETLPVDCSLGVLPDSELLEAEYANFYCDFGTDGQEQADFDFDGVLGQDDEFDFEECLAQALVANPGLDNVAEQVDPLILEEHAGQVDASFDLDAMVDIEDNNTAPVQEETLPSLADNTQVPIKTAAQKICTPPPKPIPSPLDTVFADFDGLQRILHHPNTPRSDNLTGAPLAAHLLSELAFAIRLTEIHRLWSRQKREYWYKEVDSLIRNENTGNITPWGPFSDWLVMYELGLEEVLEEISKPNVNTSSTDRKIMYWRMKRKVLSDLKLQATQLIEQTTGALLGLFKEACNYSEAEVKGELDRRLKVVQEKVVADCRANGCFGLRKTHRGSCKEKYWGT